MNLVVDGLIILGLFLLFGVSHSILASNKIKFWMIRRFGTKIAFYRLFYNLSSLVVFYIFYAFSPKPDVIIYDLQPPLDILVVVLQALSLVGFIWASTSIDVWEFLGIKQIQRYFKGTYKIEELDENLTFIVGGAFKYSRHPIYFFSILFLSFRPEMDFFYFTFLVLSIIYFNIGSYFEEKKLIERFGVRYLKYQKIVPKLIPYKSTKSDLAEEEI